jgi:hypothetical protein
MEPAIRSVSLFSVHSYRFLTDIFSSARAYPDVEFTAVINPCSGPCNGSIPDQLYLNEIPKLKSFNNIRTLGYIATTYAGKELNRVLAEIDAYANWPKVSNNTKLSMDGIFFDETPSEYTAETYQYLKVASQAVKSGVRFKDRFVGTQSLTALQSGDSKGPTTKTSHSSQPRPYLALTAQFHCRTAELVYQPC